MTQADYDWLLATISHAALLGTFPVAIIARDLLLLEGLLSLGVRVSELLRARGTDLRKEGDALLLHITRKGGKEQTLRVPASFRQALQDYRRVLQTEWEGSEEWRAERPPRRGSPIARQPG